jgi:hypothetical protein
MEKRYRWVDVGGGKRHHVTLLDAPSRPGDRVRQHAFLSEFVNDGVFNGLMNCGPIPFQRMKMDHNGTQWCIELEATEGELGVTTRRS